MSDRRSPAMAPSRPPENEYQRSDRYQSAPSSASAARISVDFSPPLIAMVAVVGTAFLIVAYFRLVSRYLLPPLVRRWRRRRRRLRRRAFYAASSFSDPESPPPPFFDDSAHHHHPPLLSPFGLDDSTIKTLPLTLFSLPDKSAGKDCAVCLLEFEHNDYVRTLPACGHAFHLDCIDIWLRTHATCPLCRSAIFRPPTPLPTGSPLVPLMSARIRPSFDDGVILASLPPEPPLPQSPPAPVPDIGLIEQALSPPGGGGVRNFLLKRSYSFSFERSLASDRLVFEPVTASPWRHRRSSLGGGGGGSSAFWRRTTSPFSGGSSSAKHRVFSLRYYRGMKSPFARRRAGFFPLSESSLRSSSSRRSKSMTSPMFAGGVGGRSSSSATASSRLRCGDPEALLSPDRLDRR